MIGRLLILCVIAWPLAVQGAPPPPPGAALLEAARSADAAGDDRRMIQLIQQWLQAQPSPDRQTGVAAPPTESTVEAWYLIGKASWRQGQTEEAVFYLKKLLKEAPQSPWVADASAVLGEIYKTQGATAEAISAFEKAAGFKRSPEFRRPIYERLVELYRRSGSLLKAVETLLTLRRMAEASDDQGVVTALTEQIGGIIAGETDADRLGRVVNAMAKRFPADLALLRLAALAAERREPYDEEQWLTRFLAEFPKHPQASEVADQLRANVAAIKAKSAVVGVLLPLSGPARLFGRSALRGVQVALETAPASPDGTSIGIVIRDSQAVDRSTASAQADAAKALERWADEFGLVAVIGPLLSREMERVAPLARGERLPVLSPGALIYSAAPPGGGGGEPNGYLFWNGLSLTEQARTAANYAVTALGAMRFMALYPNAPYGQAATEIFSAEVLRLGGEVIAAIGYPPDSTDFAAPLLAMKNADLARYGTIGPPVEGKPPDEWPYTQGFDAIFLPGSAEAGGMIASQLAFHGYEGLLLLGAGDWNRPELLTYGGRFVDGAILVDGFFAKSEWPHVREFVRRYQMRYHEEPDVFAAQAYDAMRMVINAIEQGAGRGEEVRDYLSGMKRYPGVSGQTTLVAGGPPEKQPFIVKVQNGKLVQLN